MINAHKVTRVFNNNMTNTIISGSIRRCIIFRLDDITPISSSLFSISKKSSIKVIKVFNPFNSVACCRKYILFFQTVQTQIRGLLLEPSDQDLNCWKMLIKCLEFHEKICRKFPKFKIRDGPKCSIGVVPYFIWG